MTNNSGQNEIIEIFKGFMTLMLCHGGLALFVFVFGLIFSSNYAFITIWITGYIGFLFWQLLYAIPLILRFKRQRRFGKMKGVIIGATITALLNGACFLAFFVGF